MIKLPARYCGLDTSTFITNRCTERFYRLFVAEATSAHVVPLKDGSIRNNSTGYRCTLTRMPQMIPSTVDVSLALWPGYRPHSQALIPGMSDWERGWGIDYTRSYRGCLNLSSVRRYPILALMKSWPVSTSYINTSWFTILITCCNLDLDVHCPAHIEHWHLPFFSY